MNIVKLGLMLGASAMIPATAWAQTAPAAAPAPAATAAAPAAAVGAGVVQGAQVVDTSGAPVGTIDSVEGDYVTLATSKSKVRLPKTSFGKGANGPVIAMTAAQIDAAAAQAAPAAAAAAKPNVIQGAQVADMQGGSVGTIAAVDGQFATLEMNGGTKVRLPVTAFGAGQNGGLRIAMTADQLKAAAGASGASGTSPSSSGA